MRKLDSVEKTDLVLASWLVTGLLGVVLQKIGELKKICVMEKIGGIFIVIFATIAASSYAIILLLGLIEQEREKSKKEKEK